MPLFRLVPYDIFRESTFADDSELFACNGVGHTLYVVELSVVSKPVLIGIKVGLGCFTDIGCIGILALRCGQTTPTAAEGSSEYSGTSSVRVGVVSLALGESIVVI